MAEEATTYEIIEKGTQLGKPKLVSSDGFGYTVKKGGKKGVTAWRCSVRSKNQTCHATVVQMGDTFTPGPREHCHPCDPGLLINTKLKARVKADALGNIFVGAGALTQKAIADLKTPEDHCMITPQLLQRISNRARSGRWPKNPAPGEMGFELSKAGIPEGFLKKDLTITVGEDKRRHLIFLTQDQLHLLTDARVWYLDGTFKLVKKPFYQLVSIHAFLKKDGNMKQVPLVFALMAGRRTEDYVGVIQPISQMLTMRSQVEKFMVDIEAGIWAALTQLFPRKIIQGCVFHWVQVVYGHVKEYALTTAYRKQGSIYRYIGKFFALPFLPVGDITSAFEELERGADTPELSRFTRYIREDWINPDRVWPPASLCCHRQSLRTNNDLEGWHCCINTRAVHGQQPLYKLIDILHEEAKFVMVQYQLFDEGALQRLQRLSTRSTQHKIKELWDTYQNEDPAAEKMSTSKFLRQCSFLYRPQEDK